MTAGEGRPIHILLVEDNAGDVRLTREALKEGKVGNSLTVAPDGVEALAILRQEGRYAGETRPDLILLDLNLPRLDGREVLERIKADEVLRRIPVVVLTTSKAEEDILRSYNLHANCFIAKPVEFESFVGVVRTIDEFWLAVVTLPGS
mgnify:CR=1 FL=1